MGMDLFSFFFSMFSVFFCFFQFLFFWFFLFFLVENMLGWIPGADLTISKTPCGLAPPSPVPLWTILLESPAAERHGKNMKN